MMHEFQRISCNTFWENLTVNICLSQIQDQELCVHCQIEIYFIGSKGGPPKKVKLTIWLQRIFCKRAIYDILLQFMRLWNPLELCSIPLGVSKTSSSLIFFGQLPRHLADSFLSFMAKAFNSFNWLFVALKLSRWNSFMGWKSLCLLRFSRPFLSKEFIKENVE